MEIESQIKGIPCLIEITHFNSGHSGISGTFSKHAELIDPGEPPDPGEIEFHVLDRKGYPADWLERKMSAEDINQIQEQITRAMQEDGEP